MKYVFLLLLLTGIFQSSTFAQAPESFKYQAVARNSGGQILENQNVSFRLSILQGSNSGIIVYSESHQTTTNNFGLVNLNIGDGVIENGNFSNIDWGSDLYFVKVEMDANGNMNYQTLGTSQLLSVPYSLHAKVAEVVPNDLDRDPTNEIEIPVGGASGHVLSTDGSGNYSWTENGSTTNTYSIGDFAHGGVVFWTDATGEHGLVCAIEDTGGESVPWSNGTLIVTKAIRSGIYGGSVNTERIIDIQGSGLYAAYLCASYNGGGFGDWYLPAWDELKIMYENRVVINNTATSNGGTAFASSSYWSSTELLTQEIDFVRVTDFENNGANTQFKTDPLIRVRPIRAF